MLVRYDAGMTRGDVTLRELLLGGRKRAGMTQVELMIALELRQAASVSRYETGATIPDPKVFARMISVLGLDADQAWRAWGIAYAERTRQAVKELGD